MTLTYRSYTQKLFAEAIHHELSSSPLCWAFGVLCNVGFSVKEEEHVGPYSIDVLLTLTAKRLVKMFAIECDGPCHYDPKTQRENNTRDKYLLLNHGVITQRYHVEELDTDMKFKARLAVLSAIAHYSLHDPSLFQGAWDQGMFAVAAYAASGWLAYWKKDNLNFAKAVRHLNSVNPDWMPENVRLLAEDIALNIEQQQLTESVEPTKSVVN